MKHGLELMYIKKIGGASSLHKIDAFKFACYT